MAKQISLKQGTALDTESIKLGLRLHTLYNYLDSHSLAKLNNASNNMIIDIIGIFLCETAINLDCINWKLPEIT